MKKDIENRSDIESVIRLFYDRLLQNDEFNHIFINVAQIDVMHHLDIIVNFWDSALFHNPVYKRNTMQKHLDLHKQYQLKKSHFEHWLAIFNQTVDELYNGINAHNMKTRALSISIVIQTKISHLDKEPSL